jgi:hypothetical protein
MEELGRSEQLYQLLKEVGFPILLCFLKHDSAILAISLSHGFGANRAEDPSPAT